MRDDAPKALGDLLTKLPAVKEAEKRAKPPTLIQRRLIESSATIADASTDPELCFQHTVFCQTGLPYRDPGDAVRLWERTQGQASLLIQAGLAAHPETRQWVQLGLPFGPKPRLILAYLNTQAIRTGSPVIEVEETLTAFVKRLGFASKGRNMRLIKDQLARLSAADVRLGLFRTGEAVTVKANIVTAFNLWFPKDERQRVLWPNTIQLDRTYFDSLVNHAVPLDERALAALSHSAMALDIYAWLAQRLHRVNPAKPAFVPWSALKDQFGQGYSRMNNFKRVFRQALRQVLTQYRAARLDLNDRGAMLSHSPPPIKGRIAVISKA